jgi:hypothetical protein
VCSIARSAARFLECCSNSVSSTQPAPPLPPFLFVEKSRTMMASWWAAAETLHYVMTHQPSKGIFWAQDEDRSIALLNYAWTLYDQQEPILKDIYPLSRPRARQPG